MPSICRGSAQVCAIRVARLADSCAHVAGTNQASVSSAIVRVNATPVYKAGEDFEGTNGCGALCVTLKTADSLKRVDLAMELCLRDPAMIELLTGATTYSDGTDIVGYSRRGVGAVAPASVSVEIWTKALSVTNTCPPVGVGLLDARWWRVIWPKATFTLGDVSFANEVATLSLSGFAEANPNFLNGPFNDVPVAYTLDPTSPEHTFLDDVGPPATSCGYTTVPAQP